MKQGVKQALYRQEGTWGPGHEADEQGHRQAHPQQGTPRGPTHPQAPRPRGLPASRLGPSGAGSGRPLPPRAAGRGSGPISQQELLSTRVRGRAVCSLSEAMRAGGYWLASVLGSHSVHSLDFTLTPTLSRHAQLKLWEGRAAARRPLPSLQEVLQLSTGLQPPRTVPGPLMSSGKGKKAVSMSAGRRPFPSSSGLQSHCTGCPWLAECQAQHGSPRRHRRLTVAPLPPGSA